MDGQVYISLGVACHLFINKIPRQQHGERDKKRADNTKFNTNLTVQALPSSCSFTDLDENLIQNSDFMEAFVTMYETFLIIPKSVKFDSICYKFNNPGGTLRMKK